MCCFSVSLCGNATSVMYHIQSVMTCLSATYCHEGQAHLDEAAQLAERVLDRSLEVLGRGHPLTLEGTIVLASVYKSQGKAKQAALLGQDALKLQKAFFTRSDHC